VPGVLDTAAWAKTGSTGPTVGEALQKMGHKLRRADKNRVQGKVQIHEYLKVQQNGRPKLQIFNTCRNLIRELQSIPLAKNNSEDVDTHASDHAYDALRYMIMSRPSVYGTYERLRDIKKFVPSDSTFGY
jgi:phage gp37-like protein